MSDIPTRIISKPRLVGTGNSRQLILPTDKGDKTIAEASALTGVLYQTLYSRVAYDNDRWKSPHVFSTKRLHRTTLLEDDEDLQPLGKLPVGPPKKKVPVTTGRLEKTAAAKLEEAVKKDWTPWLDEYRWALRRHLGLDRVTVPPKTTTKTTRRKER